MALFGASFWCTMYNVSFGKERREVTTNSCIVAVAIATATFFLCVCENRYVFFYFRKKNSEICCSEQDCFLLENLSCSSSSGAQAVFSAVPTRGCSNTSAKNQLASGIHFSSLYFPVLCCYLLTLFQ